MKRINTISIVLALTLLTQVTPGRAEPILLGTREIQRFSGVSQIIADPHWPVLYYYRDESNIFDTIPVFEDFALEYDYPVTVNHTVSRANDPDFDAFAAFLTDGISQRMCAGAWRWNGPGMGATGALEPLGLEFHVPPLGPDFIGYHVDYIVQDMIVNMETPGRDLNGDGNWTDWSAEGTYEFWGTPIPEPTTFGLLGLIGLPLLRRRRP